MLIHFFVPTMVDVCRKHGLEPRVAYNADGIVTWAVELPKDSPLLKDQTFVEGLIKQVMEFAPLIHVRLSPPLFFPKKDGAVAYTRDEKSEAGGLAVITGRNKVTLRYMLTNPQNGRSPDILCVNSRIKLLRVLEKAHESGIRRILYFVAPNICETIPVKDAVMIVKFAIEGRFDGPSDGTGRTSPGDA